MRKRVYPLAIFWILDSLFAKPKPAYLQTKQRYNDDIIYLDFNGHVYKITLLDYDLGQPKEQQFFDSVSIGQLEDENSSYQNPEIPAESANFSGDGEFEFDAILVDNATTSFTGNYVVNMLDDFDHTTLVDFNKNFLFSNQNFQHLIQNAIENKMYNNILSMMDQMNGGSTAFALDYQTATENNNHMTVLSPTYFLEHHHEILRQNIKNAVHQQLQNHLQQQQEIMNLHQQHMGLMPFGYQPATFSTSKNYYNPMVWGSNQWTW